MPLKTLVNGEALRNSVAMKVRPEIYQQMRTLLEKRLADLDREAEQIAKDRERVEMYLRTLPTNS